MELHAHLSIKPSVRTAAVAGSFYPENSLELEKTITDLLNQAKPVKALGKLRTLLVPHAGIMYSGRVAAWGFKQIENQNYSKIILIGASHRYFFNHVAIYAKGTWETPLGKVAIEENLASALIEKDKNILSDSSPHEDEHSLEIELIFLQKVLKDFQIIPILVSNPPNELIENLAQKISLNFDEQTLLVVSSDLSHYPSWEIANKVDKQTIEAILSGKKEFFEMEIKKLEEKSYPGVETLACGYQAIRVALSLAQNLNLRDFKKIKYENSGDTSGDKSRVVGYGALGIWGKEMPATPTPTNSNISTLDDQTKKEALTLARKTLEEYLSQKTIPKILPKSQILYQKYGAFVTLRKNGQLRGCLGEFESQKPLYQVIQERSIASATCDPRFLPVGKEELSDVKIEISVLSPKRKIGSLQEIQLGKHGVILTKDLRSGTFLPQVATETGWSLEEFLGQLCQQKVGLSPDCYKEEETTLYVFEAEVFEESTSD